jgi:hypothetical protein
MMVGQAVAGRRPPGGTIPDESSDESSSDSDESGKFPNVLTNLIRL